MELWLATGNKHKVEEFSRIMGPQYTVKSIADIPQPLEIVEDGDTYIENARKKAITVHSIVKGHVVADDSGLEVDFLDGKPGVHSMRFSGPAATHESNIAKLLGAMSGVPQEKRGARFRCCIVYITPDNQTSHFEGSVEGFIAQSPIGEGGFGYDPVFFVPKFNCTMAELPADEKDRISHRGRAVEGLKNFLGTKSR